MPALPGPRPGHGLATALLFSLASTAAAQTDQESGVWTMFFGQGSLEGVSPDLEDFRWWFDFQPRFFEDADQLLVRPGLGYAFAEDWAAWLGYAWIRTTPLGGERIDEQRIWQQLTWSTGAGPVDLGFRTRLEQRFLETGEDLGWRFRQFLKATYPLPSEPRLLFAAYDEVFFDLNDTDWGAQTGFSQNRAYAGIGWRFSPQVTVELGYLNQYIDRSGGDLMNHLLSVNLFVSF